MAESHSPNKKLRLKAGGSIAKFLELKNQEYGDVIGVDTFTFLTQSAGSMVGQGVEDTS
jgi:hypothetical protein